MLVHARQAPKASQQEERQHDSVSGVSHQASNRGAQVWTVVSRHKRQVASSVGSHGGSGDTRISSGCPCHRWRPVSASRSVHSCVSLHAGAAGIRPQILNGIDATVSVTVSQHTGFTGPRLTASGCKHATQGPCVREFLARTVCGPFQSKAAGIACCVVVMMVVVVVVSIL